MMGNLVLELIIELNLNYCHRKTICSFAQQSFERKSVTRQYLSFVLIKNYDDDDDDEELWLIISTTQQRFTSYMLRFLD